MIEQFYVNTEQITSFKQIECLMQIISDERRRRINRYFFEKDKIRSAVAETLLRYALLSRYGIRNSDVAFEEHHHKKPYLKYPNDKIYFNLSHSGDCVVCSIGDSEMGIDVEEVKEKDLSFAGSVLSEDEMKYWKNLTCTEQYRYFYRYWTLKESYVKYLGEGLYFSLNRLNFDLKGSDICLKIDNRIDESCYFAENELESRYNIALCIDRGSKDKLLREIQKVKIENLFTLKER